VQVLDLAGNEYGVITALQPPVGETDLRAVDVTASVSTVDRVAGAFNIVDVIQRAALFWLTATSIEPAAAVVHWESGGFDQEGTFYDPSSGLIFVIGGSGDLQDRTDTDEFDDVIVAHEYMHFLSANHSHSSSPGGAHGGEDLVPNLAFDEALADWFGASANGTSLYEDTIGTADGLPSCGYRDDLESSVRRVVVGIGSEQSGYEILWDLTDGGGGLADRDGDGVAVSGDELLQVVADFDEASDYPYIITLLDRLVARGALSTVAVQGLLQAPVDHDITYPPQDRDDPSSGRDVFPVPIAVGQALFGSVDSVSRPPVGDLNKERGFDAIRYYRLDLAAKTEVRITLDMLEGDGTAPHDLDLYLLDLSNRQIAVSNSQTTREAISKQLAVGSYIIAVYSFYYLTAGGEPETNAARYKLEVSG
ncbi:MAG: hypothetical protein JXA90_10630, partial [Planctomycetes bacterium]|nr:hypothetical protein [Planctomycetota bacterium]